MLGSGVRIPDRHHFYTWSASMSIHTILDLGTNIYGYDSACDWLARLHMSDVKPTMTKASSQPEPARRFFSIPPVVSSTSLRGWLVRQNREKGHIKMIHDVSDGSMPLAHFHQMQASCMRTSLRYHLMSDLGKTNMIPVRYSF